MPIYEYEHLGRECKLGRHFEISQSITSERLTACPECGQPVKRLISLCTVSTPKTNSDLKNHGFTKLVRRDNGVYENVTATGKESKIWDVRKPETMPDLKSKIRD
ncbi:MAG: zinc ribbon domain-containing protein [Desulfobulbaceae bacterium]|jgi:putative FmdB family regulatory protein|nr:zinc ribbon domain-containing protein [Desulfobulbaceae bacterium]